MTTTDIDRLADAFERVLRSDRGPAIARLLMLRSHARDSADVSAAAVRAVQRETADAFGVTVRYMHGRGRTKQESRFRMVAMYLCRELTGASYPEIGRAFGRDHTTVISACRRVATYGDAPTVAAMNRVREAIAAQGNSPTTAPVAEACEETDNP